MDEAKSKKRKVSEELIRNPNITASDEFIASTASVSGREETQALNSLENKELATEQSKADIASTGEKKGEEDSTEGDSGKKFWRKMDRHFEDILFESKQAFKINTAINIIIVVIGITLILNAIVYGWLKGTSDGWSIFSGGIGMGSLVSLFFYKSQEAVSKAVANLSIVDMVFKSHYRAYESVTDYDFKADHSKQHRPLEDLRGMLELLEKTTTVHTSLIDKYTKYNKLEKDSDTDKEGGQEDVNPSEVKK